MSYLRSRVVKLYEGMDESEEDEKNSYDPLKEQEMDEDLRSGRVSFSMASNTSSSLSFSPRGGPTRYRYPQKNSQVVRKRHREEEEEVEENEEEEVEENEEEESEENEEEENE